MGLNDISGSLLRFAGTVKEFPSFELCARNMSVLSGEVPIQATYTLPSDTESWGVPEPDGSLLRSVLPVKVFPASELFIKKMSEFPEIPWSSSQTI